MNHSVIYLTMIPAALGSAGKSSLRESQQKRGRVNSMDNINLPILFRYQHSPTPQASECWDLRMKSRLQTQSCRQENSHLNSSDQLDLVTTNYSNIFDLFDFKIICHWIYQVSLAPGSSFYSANTLSWSYYEDVKAHLLPFPRGW